MKVAESGNERAQTFCPRCGSPLYATSPDNSSAPRMVRLGIVRQREALTPKRQIWARSQPHWVAAVADLPSVDKQ